MNIPLFQLEQVNFAYKGEERLFTNLNLEIKIGESVCLLGANGSGKSTLLKIFCGLLFPGDGKFKAFGDTINEQVLENDEYSRKYHRRVGFIFQNSDVQLFNTRVWDEIAYGPMQLGLKKEEVARRVNDVLDMLNINNLSERSPHRLSGGEKKKVAVASILVLNPEVLILDEPGNGLDPKTQRWLVELLQELNKRGRTIVTSTHNLELAHTISHRAIILSERHELVYDGPTGQALDDKQLLMAVNLIDEYCHVHGANQHMHLYTHG